VGAPLSVVTPAPLLNLDRDGIDVHLPRLGPTRVGLRGRHQAANVAVADAVLDALESAGIATVPEPARRRGYADAHWPGRLELLDVPGGAGSVEVLLDGAHNPAGAASLAGALADLRPFLAGGRARIPARLTVVLGVMADKDVARIVGALTGPPLDDAAVICTEPPSARSLPAAELAAAWQEAHGAMPVVEPDPVIAIRRAIDEADGPVVVAGSLYLAGLARGILHPDPRLADPLPPATAPPIMPA
jgi:dihydrofolate synthase/folylpolyglutamate synthase